MQAYMNPMSGVDGVEQANVLIVGASRGIGFGFVQALLHNENIVKTFATYRYRESASELLTLADKYQGRLICFSMDISDELQIAQAVQQMGAAANKLHLVINCVGVLHQGSLQPEKSLSQIDADHLLDYFRVNSIGAVLLAKHLLPLFRHSDRSIFASISAKVGSIGDNRLGGWYGYRASKAALKNLPEEEATLLEPSSSAVTFPPLNGGKQRRERKAPLHSAAPAAVLSKLNMLMRTVAIEYGRKCPQAIVVMLHPGTTNTRLSKPFQKNVPPEKLFSIERTVSQLLAVLEKLDADDSGQFLSWDGRRLPW